MSKGRFQAGRDKTAMAAPRPEGLRLATLKGFRAAADAHENPFARETAQGKTRVATYAAGLAAPFRTNGDAAAR